MQKNLAEILGEHDPLIIETALVQLFVEANGILVKRNTLIKKMLGNKDEDVLAAKELLIDKVEAKNITDFVNIFDLLRFHVQMDHIQPYELHLLCFFYLLHLYLI